MSGVASPAGEEIRYKAREPAPEEMEAQRHWQYSEAQSAWIERNARTRQWEDIEDGFQREFGASPGVTALKGEAAHMGMKRNSPPGSRSNHHLAPREERHNRS